VTDPQAHEHQQAREVAKQRYQVELLQSRLSKAQERIAMLEQEVHALRTSSSWRATALLRLPGESINRFTRIQKELDHLLWLRGGWQGLWADAAVAWRQEGWQVVRNIWRWVYSGAEVSAAVGSKGHDRHDYAAWHQRFRAAAQPPQVHGLSIRFSVVMPVYKPPLHLLKLALDSVRQQTYKNWEVCIADDASGDADLTTYLNQLCEQDPRFKVTHRPSNGHISACSNTALDLATGDFVVLLDQDDLLTTDALAHVAQALHDQPQARVIYSDEDRMDEAGHHYFGPYFKSEFNYDLLLGQNTISHLGVYQRDLLVRIGGFRLGFEGSQDYDLALRAIEQVQPNQVVHIPRVLYHWRAIEGSAALDTSEKSYTVDASRRALQEHLQRTGQKAEVSACPDLAMFHRVRYALPSTPTTVSVVLTACQTPQSLSQNLSLLNASKGGVQCEWLVCWPSNQPLPTLPKDLPPVQWVLVEPGESITHAQLALQQAQHDFLCWVGLQFMHASPNWLEELVRVAAQPRAGWVAPRICSPQQRLDHGGVVLTDPQVAAYAHKGQLKGATGSAGRAILQQAFGALSHALLVADRAKFLRLGGLVCDHVTPLAMVDTCWTWGEQGVQHIWTPNADLQYAQKQDAGAPNLLQANLPNAAAQQRWVSKWQDRYQERYYNPNLSNTGDFSFNWITPSP